MTDIEELKKRLRTAAAEIRALGLKPPLIQDEIADAIEQLQRELEEARKDKERLNWLDDVNRRTNERNGTVYGWKFDMNHNRAALMDHNWPALSIRAAIDAARQQQG